MMIVITIREKNGSFYTADQLRRTVRSAQIQMHVKNTQQHAEQREKKGAVENNVIDSPSRRPQENNYFRWLSLKFVHVHTRAFAHRTRTFLCGQLYRY